MSDNYEDLYTEEIVEPCADGRGVTLDDFVAYMPAHTYLFTPCREMWPASSVNARLKPVQVYNKDGTPKRDEDGKLMKISASRWLDINRPVEQMIWAPGLPQQITNRLVADGGWIERPDVAIFNLYRPPRIKPGDATKAEPWLEHVEKVYEADAKHLIAWLAQRVQLPGEKINHALVLGGEPEIGKDTLLEPVKHAVGPWNFHEVTPVELVGRFNGFVKSTILRISEARNLGTEIDRFAFFEHTKIYAAAPPDVLRCDEKNLREHYVFNVLGLVITTNYKTDGIYLPANDRRHYVAWSNRKKSDFKRGYFNRLWDWYYAGGFKHVAAYLAELDISGFDPKASPPKTPAFWDIVNASRAPEDGELADVLDALGSPKALTLTQLIAAANGETAEWLAERKNRRAIPHRLERAGYVSVQNPDRETGLWVVQDKRQVIYAKSTLLPAERLQAARKLASDKS